MSDLALLAKTANHLRTVAGFIAFELDRYRQLAHVNPAEEFALPVASLTRLELCRLPRRDCYAADVTAIAGRVGVPATSVANLLRTVDAVTALASRGTTASTATLGPAGMLAAARDHAEEHTEFEEPSAGATLPGWLGRAVDRFWGEEMAPHAFPRDLHLPILLNLPVAIVEIDALTVDSLGQWLQTHQLPALAAVADRPLRGCVAAYAGVGVLFVDRADEPNQRRLTLAHEVGHFVVDYLMPREDVARRRPDLLTVLDGDRAPTDPERFDALIADVPLGFHTHLLERDTHGGHLASATAEVEDRAERLALELLAPLRSVLHETTARTAPDSETDLRERFGLPVGAATRYANYIQRLRPRRPRNVLDAVGLAEPNDTAPRPRSLGDQETDK
jgi:hypothetical protein